MTTDSGSLSTPASGAGLQPALDDAPRPSIVIGLGNPGRRYAATRHNVGQWCIDRLGKRHGIALSGRSRLADVGEGIIGGRGVALAKPRTYVNESGRAVTSLMARYSAGPGNLLVVYDDMDLPAGSIRLRARGGSGGHNGMKSVIAATGAREFARLRVGIGRPSGGVGEVEHVLSSMRREDRDRVEEAVNRAADAIETVLTDGVEAAMNRFN